MKVFIEKEQKTVEIEAKTGIDLVSQLEISPSTVILIRNGEVALLEDELGLDDEIKLLSVISGG